MWVLLYVIAVIGVLLAGQAVLLRLYKQPLQWTFGASSQQPKSLKIALKTLLQLTLVGSILLLPLLMGTTPAAYYGPLLPWAKARHFLYGEAIALFILGAIFALEGACGWLYWDVRWPWKKTASKCAFSTLSSLTVVAIEEPLFRGVILAQLLTALPTAAAIGLGAALFSVAHFLRKMRTYWPAVGLAVLGVWLGVAFYRTGSLWLPMGLHSGGILSIGIHRCFLSYRGPEWLIGTQTFPIAGVISIAVMLAGTAVTWSLFPGP